ncbi:hypothetical protein ACTFIT_009932 [Dictyostelium discoideum]
MVLKEIGHTNKWDLSKCRAKKHGKFAVLLVREPIYGTHDILFFKNPPNDSNFKKIIKSKPCYIDFHESKNFFWGTSEFTDSTNVLKNYLNERGELELYFTINIKGEETVPL